MAFSIFAQKIGNWFQWTNKYFLWCKIWKSSLTVSLGHLLWLVWGRKKFHKELFHHRFIKNFFTTPGFFIHKACHKAFFLAGRQFDDFLVGLELFVGCLCLQQETWDCVWDKNRPIWIPIQTNELAANFIGDHLASYPWRLYKTKI